MRVNSINLTSFGTYIDPLRARQKRADDRVSNGPVITHRAETQEQLDAFQKSKDAKAAYDEVKNDKAVDQATKQELELAMKLADKAYLRSLGLNA